MYKRPPLNCGLLVGGKEHRIRTRFPQVITINHLASSCGSLAHTQHPHVTPNITLTNPLFISVLLFVFRRWEAVHMPVARMRVAVRQVGRADATLPKAHGRQTVQVHRLRAELCTQRSPGAAHEATLTKKQIIGAQQQEWSIQLCRCRSICGRALWSLPRRSSKSSHEGVQHSQCVGD